MGKRRSGRGIARFAPRMHTAPHDQMATHTAAHSRGPKTPTALAWRACANRFVWMVFVYSFCMHPAGFPARVFLLKAGPSDAVWPPNELFRWAGRTGFYGTGLHLISFGTPAQFLAGLIPGRCLFFANDRWLAG